jgi:hypothetical protein
MKLLDLQFKFTRLVADLIEYAYENGYTMTLGEGYDDDGHGHMVGSLHYIRMAQDINLFKNGVYLTNSKDYKLIGNYWKSLSGKDYTCAWGGDFKKPDGNHFSIAFNGKK